MNQIKTRVECDKVRSLNSTEKKNLGLQAGVQYIQWSNDIHEVVPNSYMKKDDYSGKPSIMVWIVPVASL
jgi:hypothetical protein